MKRARSPESAADPPSKVARPADAIVYASMTPFDLPELFNLILGGNPVAPKGDVALVARMRLVCRAFYATLAPMYPPLGRIPMGHGDYLSWPYLSFAVGQVVRAGVQDPRFLSKEWLARRTVIRDGSARVLGSIGRPRYAIVMWRLPGQGGLPMFALSCECSFAVGIRTNRRLILHLMRKKRLAFLQHYLLECQRLNVLEHQSIRTFVQHAMEKGHKKVLNFLLTLNGVPPRQHVIFMARAMLRNHSGAPAAVKNKLTAWLKDYEARPT